MIHITYGIFVTMSIALVHFGYMNGHLTRNLVYIALYCTLKQIINLK